MAIEPESILKGRMAEGLVEELLKQCGNRVYRFGYEAVLQNLTQLEKVFDRESEVGQRIKSIPDFIVINKEGRPFFVEAKFRTELVVYSKDIKRIELIEKFWKAKIILLTTQRPYFRISNSPYLNERGGWNWIPLEEDKDLNITPDILNQFNGLVEKYYLKESNQF
jgi:hypothetical protein